MGRTGLERPAISSDKSVDSKKSDALSGAPGTLSTASNPSADPDLAPLLAALGKLPDTERGDLIGHLRALAKLSPGKRAAIYTLTRE